MLRGLILGALAAPFVLLALAYGYAYFGTLLAIVGGVVGLVLLVAALYVATAPKPRPPEPDFAPRARGAPLDPEG